MTGRRIETTADVAAGTDVELLDEQSQRVVDHGTVTEVYGLINGLVQGRVSWKKHGPSDGNLSSRFIRRAS